MLLDISETLYKAEDEDLRDRKRKSEASSASADETVTEGDEGNERAPGGAEEDTPENAPVPDEPSTEGARSLLFDPYAIVQQLGYKERATNMTYGTLRSIAWKLPPVRAVIQTRINQIAAFSTPQRDRYQMGWRIKMRDSEEQPSPADKKWIKQMEPVILRTGVTENPRERDSFETFLKKLAKDTLVYDQMCFEVVPDKMGRPVEWCAVDAATFRLADMKSVYRRQTKADDTKFVQIYDGMVINEYTDAELAFGVRNPSTEIRLLGYGTSELEMLTTTVTDMLNALTYNRNIFSQGAIHKGVLNFKGTIPDKQLRAFRRHWYTALASVENSWRTPITNAEDLQWVSMHSNTKDMEFNAYVDFLLKVACAMYAMDPSEINFKYGDTGKTGGLGESNNKEKIVESKERGLRPLLRFIALQINTQILWPINESFEFEFIGLDAMTRDELAGLNKQRVSTSWTVDEVRAEEDKPPLPDGKGEVILDPTWAQLAQAADAPDEEPGFGDDEGNFGQDPGEDNPFEQDEGDDPGDGDEQDKFMAEFNRNEDPNAQTPDQGGGKGAKPKGENPFDKSMDAPMIIEVEL